MQHQYQHENNFKINHLITPDEPEAFKVYRELNEKNAREIEEMQRLCCEIFISNPSGKRLYEILTEKYLLPAKFSPIDNNAVNLAFYWEGFKAAIRGLKEHALAHVNK